MNKFLTITVLMVTASLPAQPGVSPGAPPPIAIPNPAGTAPANAPVIVVNTNSARTFPRAVAPRATNSIVVPNNPSPSTSIITPEKSVTMAPATVGHSDLDEPAPEGLIDFRNADINQVLEVYALLVHRTILRSATLPATAPGGGQITLKTQGNLTKRESIQALEGVLAMNGIAMINVGEKFVKAQQLQLAQGEGQEFSRQTADQLPVMGQYITHVVQLKFAKPTELLPVLTPFAKNPAGIMAIDSSQILVLRDYTENVKRMLELIATIDVSVPSEFEDAVIPIKYAKATEIASALNSLSSGGGGTTVGASSGGSRSASGTRSSTSGFNRTGTSGGGYQGGGNPSSPFGQQGTTTSPAQTPASSSFSERLSNLVRKAGQTGDINILGQTKMIADERSNSLLIYASHEDMKTIKGIISKLDVVLAQVLIEAVIIEVTLSDNRSLGLNYAMKEQKNIGNFNGIGAINNGTQLTPNSFLNAVGSGTNSTGSSLPGGLSFLGTFGQDLDVTVTAVASDSHAKILQRPRIQTSHNEPASLFVGESRPYPSGSFYGGGSFGGYSSIQAVNIGVTLEVTPLINPDGLVVMDIHQTIESANGTVVIANVGEVPVTSRKEAVAKVSVRDHDTIMLGGLIETSKSKSVSGVPFLKDIPLLGNLFRSTSDKEVRNELIVLIRPTVLPTPEVAAMTARAEKDRMPGVRRAEAEILEEDAKRLRNANKDLEGGDKKARKSPPPDYNPASEVIPAPAPSPVKSDDGKFSEPR